MSWYDPTTWDWSKIDPTTTEGLANLAAPLTGGLSSLAYYGIEALSSPKSGDPPGLPSIPILADEAVIRAQYLRKQKLAAMKGRASTFLTGPRGVGLGMPGSDVAMAFLRASLEDPAPGDYTSGPGTRQGWPGAEVRNPVPAAPPDGTGSHGENTRGREAPSRPDGGAGR